MTPEQAEEQVRQDAADRMQHSTTSDLSARLMCRVGFRELTLLLAHYDGLKRAHQPLRIPVELDEAQLPQVAQAITALLAENERLREALAPFAEASRLAKIGGYPPYQFVAAGDYGNAEAALNKDPDQ